MQLSPFKTFYLLLFDLSEKLRYLRSVALGFVVLSIEKLKRDFTKRFKSVSSGSRNRYDVFRDWAECAAISAYNSPVTTGILSPNSQSDAMEKRYLEIVANYKKDELLAFTEMFAIVQMALNLAKVDFLGQLYEELELGGKRTKGEFFTPFSVAKLMAQVTFDEQQVQSLIEEKGYVTVYEPCVGAGNLLIAAARQLEELGHDPKKHMLFTAVDVNKMFCHLTYIAAASLDLMGWVCHGNSLSEEMWEQWSTPRLDIVIRKDDATLIAKLQMVFEEFAASDKWEKPTVAQSKSEAEPEPQEKVGEKKPTAEADFTPRQLNLFNDQ